MADETPVADRLREIQARAEKATAGPWNVVGPAGFIYATNPYGHGDMHVLQVRGWGHLTGRGGGCAMDEGTAAVIQDANADFTAHARQDIPWLLTEHARLQAEHATTAALLNAVSKRANAAEAARDEVITAWDYEKALRRDAEKDQDEAQRQTAALRAALEAIRLDLENAYGTLPEVIEAQFDAALAAGTETP